MTSSHRIELLGAPGSPYTRKMLATLRYRRIAHNILWGGHQNPPEGYPAPRVKLLPCFYFTSEDGQREAMVDSTPITRRLETEYAGRQVIPGDHELAFYNELIEDYGDEWLTKAMFHYRWHHKADRENAGPLLIFWSNATLPDDLARKQADQITQRQYDRLYVVGSNDITAQTIEDSFVRFVDILDTLIAQRGYILGARPCSADFAVFGQLTQLGIIEPTSAAIIAQRSPRLRAWLDRMEDLSGLEPSEDDWFEPTEARTALAPLLSEIGRVYVPFLRANAGAAGTGLDRWEAQIDGRTWTQPTFAYQVKCLEALREAHRALPENVRPAIDEMLSRTGCDGLVGD